MKQQKVFQLQTKRMNVAKLYFYYNEYKDTNKKGDK